MSREEDPIFAISQALSCYVVAAYPSHIPSFAARLALIQEISEKAQALVEVFVNTGEDTYFDIERSLSRGLDQEPSADMPETGFVSPEISFFREFSAGDIFKFSDLMRIATKEFPNDPDAPPKGRPPKTALVELIRELAWVYERQTKQDAYKGFSADPETGDYDSAFFRFAWAVISKFDPSAAKTNNALGSQIRKALANYTPEIEMEVFYEGDDADPGAK